MDTNENDINVSDEDPGYEAARNDSSSSSSSSEENVFDKEEEARSEVSPNAVPMDFLRNKGYKRDVNLALRRCTRTDSSSMSSESSEEDNSHNHCWKVYRHRIKFELEKQDYRSVSEASKIRMQEYSP